MAHWIEDRIQTESGLDLLTESNEPLIRGIIGVSGEVELQGTAGVIVATGTISGVPQPEITGSGWFKPVPITRILFGTVATQGKLGNAQATGTARLTGKAQNPSVITKTDLTGVIRMIAAGSTTGRRGDLSSAARLRLAGLIDQCGLPGCSTLTARLYLLGRIAANSSSPLVMVDGFIDDELALLLALLD